MKLKIKIFALLILAASPFAQLRAQEDSTAFTLEQAIQFAMENSYVLRNTGRDISIAQKQVWEAISTGLPQVSGTANYNAFLNLPVSLLPGEIFGGEPGTYIPVKFGQDYNSDFGLQINQLLFDGTYIVGVGSTQIYLNISKAAHEKSQINIREAVSQAYYAVLIALRYREVMMDNLLNVEELSRETKAYFDNGFREEQDVDQVSLMLRNAKNEVLKAEREIVVSKVVLKYAMGYELNNDIFLTDDLNQFLRPLELQQSTFRFDFNSHIDYRIATANFQVSEKMLSLEKVAYLPKLNSFYSYTKSAYGNKANLFNSKTEWYPSSMVGLQLTVPIFNSGQKHVKVQQAKIELEKAETQRKITERTLQKDYLTAVAQLESALESFQNDKENRALAERIRLKTKIKFDNGVSTSTELSQIETQYITAYQTLVASTLQLLQADLNLKKATGNL